MAWYENWFNSKYYHILYQNRDEEEAHFFMDNILSFINPKEKAQILDLACGKGRHSIYLAKKKFNVVGLDLSEESIAHARQFEQPNLEFYSHDMRHPFRTNYFDMIFNLFTSFGYFDNPKDDLSILKSVEKGLKTNGLFLLDFFNLEYVLQNLVFSERKRLDGIDFHITRKVENGFVKKKIEFVDAGQKIEHEEKVRAFGLEDFEKLFAQTNLTILKVFGDYALNDFNLETSPRLILLAQLRNI